MEKDKSGKAVAQNPYHDLIDLPHHVSPTHPPMPLYDRAAQFSPFAALTGHEAAILETGRLTEERIILEESEKERIGEVLNEIDARLKVGQENAVLVELTYFVPDRKKDGGAYRTEKTTVRKLDHYGRKLFLGNGKEISLEELIQIQIE